MSFVSEFKAFITKGSVVELAVAVIIGTAFGAIINSLVEDVITPLILAPFLKAAGQEDIAQLSRNGVKYGKFLAAILKFLIVALVLFSIIKTLNRYSKKKDLPPAGPSSTDLLLIEIRDAVKAKQ